MTKELVARITDCLTKGGLFNMEMMEAGKVTDLLIDCRAALSASTPGVSEERRVAVLDCGCVAAEISPTCSAGHVISTFARESFRHNQCREGW